MIKWFYQNCLKKDSFIIFKNKKKFNSNIANFQIENKFNYHTLEIVFNIFGARITRPLPRNFRFRQPPSARFGCDLCRPTSSHRAFLSGSCLLLYFFPTPPLKLRLTSSHSPWRQEALALLKKIVWPFFILNLEKKGYFRSKLLGEMKQWDGKKRQKKQK